MLRLLIFVSLMPYISPIPFPMDTAPYALAIICFLISLIILDEEKSSIKIKKNDVLPITIIFFMVGALILRLFYFWELDSFRILGNYISLMLFYLFFSILVTKSKLSRLSFLQNFSELIVFVSFLYLGGTLLQVASRLIGIQMLFDFTDMLISADISLRTSESRGFTSFAAEPSYAGIVCSLLSCISSYLFRAKYIKPKLFLITSFNYFTVIILSAAATALPFLILAILAISASFNYRIKVTLFSFISLGIVTIIKISNEYSEIRFFYLISSFINDGFSFLFDDVSFLVRFSSPLLYSLPLFSGQNLFGHVLTSVNPEYLSDIVNKVIKNVSLIESLEIGLSEGGGGIMTLSAIGQSFFLFGAFSALFWVIFVRRLSFVDGLSNGRLFILFSIIIGFLIQVPLGHPTFLMAIGLLMLPPSNIYNDRDETSKLRHRL